MPDRPMPSGLDRLLIRLVLPCYPAELRRRGAADLESSLLHAIARMRSAPVRSRGRRFIALRIVAHLMLDLARAYVAERRSDIRAPRRGRADLTALALDVRHAVRRLRRRPGFALTAILTVGAGIGGATSVYTVVDDVLLEPLPWRDPDRLVTVWQVRPEWRDNPVLAAYADLGTFSWAAFRELQTRQSVFSDVAAITTPRPVLRGHPNEEVEALQVSSEFLPMLGVQPTRGRAFDDAENDADTDAVLVSYEAWQQRFGGGPDVLGRAVSLDDEPAVIVGVLPPGFTFNGSAPEFLLPIGRLSAEARTSGGNFLHVVARLAPGATTSDAERVTTDVLRQGNPSSTRASRVATLADEQFGDLRAPLLLLLAASGVLLLITCANVVGLLVADAGSRRAELAVRSALGAGGWRLTRQLLVEGACLGLSGAAAGILVATWLTPAMLELAPAALPGTSAVALDGRSVAFAVLSGLAASVLFGLGARLSSGAGSGGSSVASWTSGRATVARRRIPQVVVAGQMALAFALLVGASLFGETLVRLHQQPLGFDPEGLTLTDIRPPAGSANTSAARRQQVANILDALEVIPGVASAAGTAAAPFGGNFGTTRVAVDDEPERTRTTQQVAVTSDYFDVLGLPVLQGRTFDPADETDAHVAVVSKAFADRYLAGGAVGRHFRASATYRVIGVVENLKYRRLNEDDAIAFYALERHLPNQGLTQFVTRAVEPSAGPDIAAIREAVHRVHPALTVVSVARIDHLVWQSTAGERFRAALTTAFSALALAIAAIGVYGVVSRAIAERRRELGIRLALGAARGRVFAMVLGEAGLVALVGLAAGLPLAMLVARLVESLLFGVPPGAVHVFATAGGVLAAAALAAAWAPARAASRLAPAETLRAN